MQTEHHVHFLLLPACIYYVTSYFQWLLCASCLLCHDVL